MKKLLLAIAIICTLSGAALGATSEDMSVYVRQDVFDARMDKFETKLNQLHDDIQRLNTAILLLDEKFSGKLDTMNTRISALENRINDNQAATSARIDDLKTIIYWGLSILGLILGFAIFAPALGEFLRELRKPSITLEDVDKLIDTKLRTMQLQ